MFCIRALWMQMLAARYQIIASLYDPSTQLHRIHEFTVNSISLIADNIRVAWLSSLKFGTCLSLNITPVKNNKNKNWGEKKKSYNWCKISSTDAKWKRHRFSLFGHSDYTPPSPHCGDSQQSWHFLLPSTYHWPAQQGQTFGDAAQTDRARAYVPTGQDLHTSEQGML